MKSPNVIARRNAASKLLSLPPKMARRLVLAALQDGDDEVRIRAAQVATALEVEGAGDQVASWLQENDSRLRRAACDLIEVSPSANALQSLARVLGDSQASVRRAAATALGASGMPEVVSPLLGRLDDGSEDVRVAVIRALARLGYQRAVVPLVSKLQDPYAGVRREAARALGQLGDQRAVATLMLALQDKDVGVRVDCLRSLGQLRAKQATPAIAALLSGRLQGQRGPLRDAALASLGQIAAAGDAPEAVNLLVASLENEGPVPLGGAGSNAPVRAALVEVGAAASERLVALLNGAASERRASAAVLVLAAMGSKKHTADIVSATQRGRVGLRAALSAIAAMGDSAALPFVLEQMDHADPSTRALVIQTAAALLHPEDADGRLVDVVAERATDLTTALGEKIALAKLLGQTGSVRAIKLLLVLAKSKHTSLRIAVLRALGVAGTARSITPANKSEKSAATKAVDPVDAVLLEALEDQVGRLRLVAARALAKVGRDAAASEVLRRLEFAAEQDRAALGIALSGALGRSHNPKLVDRVRQMLVRSKPAESDALIEGLGRMQTKESLTLLLELLGKPRPYRRKVAEALGNHPSGAAGLVGLLGDHSPAVRANAVWSLGRIGRKAELAAVTSLLSDADAAVAANAATSIGRIAARENAAGAVQRSLCGAAGDYRSYVRYGALVGLRLAGAHGEPGSCGNDAEPDLKRILRRDVNPRVRQAAAELLRSVPAVEAGLLAVERQALLRCASDDHDAAVAASCSMQPRQAAGDSDQVAVYVVPNGHSRPSGSAPFALLFADGTMRLGLADRRGVVFEHAAPRGRLELALPTALAP